MADHYFGNSLFDHQHSPVRATSTWRVPDLGLSANSNCMVIGVGIGIESYLPNSDTV